MLKESYDQIGSCSELPQKLAVPEKVDKIFRKILESKTKAFLKFWKQGLQSNVFPSRYTPSLQHLEDVLYDVDDVP